MSVGIVVAYAVAAVVSLVVWVLTRLGESVLYVAELTNRLKPSPDLPQPPFNNECVRAACALGCHRDVAAPATLAAQARASRAAPSGVFVFPNGLRKTRLFPQPFFRNRRPEQGGNAPSPTWAPAAAHQRKRQRPKANDAVPATPAVA